MKRFHVHVGVADLEQSIRFYTGLFGAEPTVRRGEYAKWMIEDPRVNFAISRRGGRVGVNHLGLQADSADELADIRRRFSAAAADAGVEDEPGVSCCYAKSDKHWVADPQGIAWEGYQSLSEIRYFDRDSEDVSSASACCGPRETSAVACGASAETGSAACCAPASEGRAKTSQGGACCA
jgi:catechol 2,3-dioxygenase-like lactoylglutathione lyase family enzyme